MRKPILILIFLLAGIAVFGFACFPETKAELPKPGSGETVPQDIADAGVKDSLPALPDSLSKVDTLLVAWKSEYRMRIYHKGKPVKTYIIGLGQEPVGHKQQQGDNRTPEGDYKIIQKSRGPFEGAYAHYLGVAWMRLNYPNNRDAINGYAKKLITETQKNAIIKANNEGREPLKTTKLGGGIGIHGWYGEWPENDRQNLTWGCITVQNTELDDLYTRVKAGTRVVVFP